MEFNLQAKSRQVGKDSQLTDIRNSAQVPGVVYGLKSESHPLTVGYNEVLKIITQAGTSNIINLKVDNKDFRVIVREYQQNSVSDKITHVDFLQIADNHPITTKVPLEFIGASIAVKEKGGKLNIREEKVNVKCLPVDLPSAIKVDVTILAELGQSILIKDLPVSNKVNILNNPTDPVVSVTVPKKIIEVASTGTAAVAGTEGEAPVESEKPAEGEAKEDAKAEDKK